MIVIEDIIKDNVIISEDTRCAGYNLGDLLNMPHLNGDWNSSPHHDNAILDRMNLLSKYYKNSILQYYCEDRNENEYVPNINKIVNCVNKFIKNVNIDIDIIKNPNTLCVHLRNGDLDTEIEFINLIIKLSFDYEYIIILSGIHLDEHYKSYNDKTTNFINTINLIIQKNKNIYFYLGSPDIHLSIMSQSSNLLLHKGGFSCLGSIVSTGNLFITKLFNHANHNHWKIMVNKKYTLLEI